jgi:hypothetical protein
MAAYFYLLYKPMTWFLPVQETIPAPRLPHISYALAVRAQLGSSTLLRDGPVAVAIVAMIGITGNQVGTFSIAYRAGTARCSAGGIGQCALSFTVGTTLIHNHLIAPVANCMFRMPVFVIWSINQLQANAFHPIIQHAKLKNRECAHPVP